MRIPLTPLGLYVCLMCRYVNDVEREKSAVALDITEAQEVGLVNLVSPKNFSEIRIANPFRNIRSFF